MEAKPTLEAASLPEALGRLHVALDDAYARASHALGLTAPQAQLLCAALRPATVGKLAETLRCDRSNVTRLVDRAAEHGLVRRRASDDDRRVTMIELTSEGRRLAEGFVERLESETHALRAEWTDERHRSASATLNDIADAIDGAERRQAQRRRAAKHQTGRVDVSR
jgi:DNA-binding MarR family transcriptional regulator